jgi:hypothetical protein
MLGHGGEAKSAQRAMEQLHRCCVFFLESTFNRSDHPRRHSANPPKEIQRVETLIDVTVAKDDDVRVCI